MNMINFNPIKHFFLDVQSYQTFDSHHIITR